LDCVRSGRFQRPDGRGVSLVSNDKVKNNSFFSVYINADKVAKTSTGFSEESQHAAI
jgi:hypothetical protein